MTVFATGANRVTDEMFIVAARAVAEQVTDESLAAGLIYPSQSRILPACLHVAEKIAAHIFGHGLAGVPRPGDVGHWFTPRLPACIFELDLKKVDLRRCSEPPQVNTDTISLDPRDTPQFQLAGMGLQMKLRVDCIRQLR